MDDRAPILAELAKDFLCHGASAMPAGWPTLGQRAKPSAPKHGYEAMTNSFGYNQFTRIH
jgi:hypothetical protein